MSIILRSPDPGPGDSGGAAPASVATVKKTSPASNLPPPSVIALQKRMASMEDDVTGLKGWREEINTFLAELGLGGPKAPAPAKKDGVTPQPAPAKGILEQLADDVLGD